MAKTITATIGDDGNVTIETSGFTGAECLQATLAIEEALGAKTQDTKTGEFYTTAKQGNVQRERM